MSDEETALGESRLIDNIEETKTDSLSEYDTVEHNVDDSPETEIPTRNSIISDFATVNESPPIFKPNKISEIVAAGLWDAIPKNTDSWEAQLNHYEFLDDVSERTSITKVHLAGIFLSIFLAFAIFGIGSSLLCLALGVIYPIFMSFKAIEETTASMNPGFTQRWLRYWVVFSILEIAEVLLSSVLHRLPLYFFLKTLLLLWCVHPDSSGSELLYTLFVLPFAARYKEKLIQIITEVRSAYHYSMERIAKRLRESLDTVRGQFPSISVDKAKKVLAKRASAMETGRKQQ